VNSVVLNLDKMLRSLISENIELKTDLADNLGPHAPIRIRSNRSS